jgi:prolyl-tRNA editing enzyme YbaK/EbsC (Cys-tRNA(Pro) deacylase)
MVFGDPTEPHHREALALTVRTEEAVAAVLRRDQRIDAKTASTLAHVISAVMFISMAATVNIGHSVDEVIAEIREQIQALLPH